MEPVANWRDYLSLVEREIPKALSQGENLDDVFARLDEGTAQLWVVDKSVVVTFGSDGEFWFWLASGDLTKMCEHLLEPIEQWARDRGFDRMLIFGRRGWSRSILISKGYVARSLLYKQLN